MTNTTTRQRPFRILILGGTGFVGHHLVRLFVEAGHDVTIASRDISRHHALMKQPDVRLVNLNMDQRTENVSDGLRRELEGQHVLINLIGILNEPRHNGKTFERVHVALSKIALTAASGAGVKRYLHMSALGADATQGTSFYLRSKGKAEDWVHEFGPQHDIAVTSFRPSVIFGPHDSFLNRFAQLARFLPGVFPLACAHARFAPVYVNDVSRYFVKALTDPETIGQRIDLCGPEEYALQDLVSYAARVAGHPRLVIALPDWMARMQAFALEFVPGKPFTRDNYASMQTPNVCSVTVTRQPTRLEDVAPDYLRR